MVYIEPTTSISGQEEASGFLLVYEMSISLMIHSIQSKHVSHAVDLECQTEYQNVVLYAFSSVYLVFPSQLMNNEPFPS